MNYKKCLSIAFFCLTLSSFQLRAEENIGEFPSLGDSIPAYSPTRLEISGIVGEGFGKDRRCASLKFFHAPKTFADNLQPFIDIREYYLSHDEWATNLGAGLRWFNSNDRIWGVNVYYDLRTRYRTFNQIGVGFESLGECLDFRLNGYFVMGRKKRARSTEVYNYPGGFRMTCTPLLCAGNGANAEVGTHFGLCYPFKFYTAIGPYYYGSKAIGHFWGGLLRLKAYFKDYFSLEGRVSYDRKYHLKGQGIFTVSIPFDYLFNACGCSMDICRGLLFQPVERNEIIPLDKRCCWRQNF